MKEKKYAINDEELLAGYFVVAAPVLNPNGRCVAAISVTFTITDFKTGGGDSFVPAILDAAQQASIQLGYKPSPFVRRNSS